MKNNIVTLQPLHCSGCSACQNICRSNAISMEQDSEGFLYPTLNDAECNDCRMCLKVCPSISMKMNPAPLQESPTAYAAFHMDHSIRMKSSSGGIFSALAETVINHSGIVYGAGFTDKLELMHLGIDHSDGMVLLRGSKYFQSSVGLSYRKVKQELLQGKYVLFSGTPCQIAGLYGFLGGQIYPSLFTVDVVCHGVTSSKVFRKYATEFAEGKGGKTTAVDFRDKVTGWKGFSVTTTVKSPPEKNGEFVKKSFSQIHYDNSFMRAFLDNICLRKSCYQCSYAKFPRIADITLADYWGGQRIHPEFSDNKGISLVVLNTVKGVDLWNSIAGTVISTQTELEKAVHFNPRIQSSIKEHPQRKIFYEELDTRTLSELVDSYCIKQAGILLLCKKILRRVVFTMKRTSQKIV